LPGRLPNEQFDCRFFRRAADFAGGTEPRSTIIFPADAENLRENEKIEFAKTRHDLCKSSREQAV
jgi:hypothetical protein